MDPARFFSMGETILGDVNAIRRGPNAIAKREIRKIVMRQFARQVGRWLK